MQLVSLDPDNPYHKFAETRSGSKNQNWNKKGIRFDPALFVPHESDEDGFPGGDEVAGAGAGHQRRVDAVGHVGHLDLAPARVDSV